MASKHHNFTYNRRRPIGWDSLTVLSMAMILAVATIVHRHSVDATNSINYAIGQQPITDINQLMPVLCQNQSVICEGSFCIPGVRKCVCDLRLPIQVGRFCLRQVDIETKCFATNQCNNTVKGAVCVDIHTNAIMDAESSKLKLDHWQQITELRQQSLNKDISSSTLKSNTKKLYSRQATILPLSVKALGHVHGFHASNSPISNIRNSPYEINYASENLMLQNHTRRRVDSTSNDLNHKFNSMAIGLQPQREFQDMATESNTTPPTTSMASNSILDNNSIYEPSTTTATTTSTTTTTTTTTSNPTTVLDYTTIDSFSQLGSTSTLPVSDITDQSLPTTSKTLPETNQRAYGNPGEPNPTSSVGRKYVAKSWPPGICSCPRGTMFDPMLRKCLSMSLAESHCQTDLDCRQITSTHCSMESRKCECDEPLVWKKYEQACIKDVQQPPISESTNPPLDSRTPNLIERIIFPPLLLATLLQDYIILLLVIVVIVIIITVIVIKVAVKCCSWGYSALTSPKTGKKRQHTTNSLPPRSPYATLRRPEHRPNSELSNFTQVTRGRILNYDFEQESPKHDKHLSHSPLPSTHQLYQTLPRSDARLALSDKMNGTIKSQSSKTLKRQMNAGHSGNRETDNGCNVDLDNPVVELNDNISISQGDESKSDNSGLTLPGPTPNQPPPYMLASAIKAQGSAVAAAAAAVANKRMQSAQKRNLEQQSNNRQASGSPVYL